MGRAGRGSQDFHLLKWRSTCCSDGDKKFFDLFCFYKLRFGPCDLCIKSGTCCLPSSEVSSKNSQIKRLTSWWKETASGSSKSLILISTREACPKVSQEGREGASGPQRSAALKRRGKGNLTPEPKHRVRASKSLMER